jgi:hypothetical protein
MTDMGPVVLQNCIDLEKDPLGLCSETCPSSSHDADQDMNMKVKEVSDLEEEEDSVPITFPGIKAEREVSYIK